jgi:hypothetical protein
MKPKARSAKFIKVLAALIILLIVGWVIFIAYPSGIIPAIRIPQQADASPVLPFIGQEATPKPIDAPDIPINPYMSPGSWSAMHNNTYMSDTYQVSGPLGHSPVVKSTFLGKNKDNPLGIVIGMTFDSAGKIVAASAMMDNATSTAWVRLSLINPVSLARFTWLDLPGETFEAGHFRPAGVYFYQDQNDRILVGTPEREIWLVSHTDKPLYKFEVERKYDLRESIPSDDGIQALQPDFSGLLWFTTSGGVVGTLDLDTGLVLGVINLPGEKIVNGSAADETGGVYIATTRAMYRFDAGPDRAPAITWQETYDAGTQVKPGQVNIGTGTTPTLMGTEYVTITDNAEPRMQVLVYRRAKEVQGMRLVCSEPVFKPGNGSNENSLVATDKSIIVENNFGYVDITSTQNGLTTEPGITRIDVDETGCHTVWTNETETIPTLVTKMSLKNGLIYTYTKAKGPENTDAWYLTAIDFWTGKTVFKQLAGTGTLYNNHYAPLYLGPNGTAYVGILGGLVAIRDSQP